MPKPRKTPSSAKSTLRVNGKPAVTSAIEQAVCAAITGVEPLERGIFDAHMSKLEIRGAIPHPGDTLQCPHCFKCTSREEMVKIGSRCCNHRCGKLLALPPSDMERLEIEYLVWQKKFT